MMMRLLFGILCCVVVANVHILCAGQVSDDQFTYRKTTWALAGAGAAAGVYCYGKGGDLSSYAKPLGVGAATFLFSTHATNWFHTDIRNTKRRALGDHTIANDDAEFKESFWGACAPYNVRLIAMNLLIGAFAGATSWFKPEISDRYLLGSIFVPPLLLGGAYHVKSTYDILARVEPRAENFSGSSKGVGSGCNCHCNGMTPQQAQELINGISEFKSTVNELRRQPPHQVPVAQNPVSGSSSSGSFSQNPFNENVAKV